LHRQLIAPYIPPSGSGGGVRTTAQSFWRQVTIPGLQSLLQAPRGIGAPGSAQACTTEL
jgi:hypothetical protein